MKSNQQKVKNVFYRFHVSNYLSNVNFDVKWKEKGDGDKKIRYFLLEKLDLDFEKAKSDIKKSLKVGEKCNQWVNCKDDCEKTVIHYMKKETESTAYMLKVISESVINLSDDNSVIFKFDMDNLDKCTGKWKDDFPYFNLSYKNRENRENRENRLIMGFGPSASGKTFWAKSIISILRKLEKDFTDIFISIDGGLYRESTIIYMITRDVAVESCYSGFSNLVLASFSLFQKSLFKSDEVKREVMNYLSYMKSKGESFSLYVPETLGDCGGLKNIRIKKCKEKYKPYIELTGDKKWIGLMIWQHRYGKECDQPEGFKCIGTTESGISREKNEGKKYSNAAWFHSMKLGIKHLKKAPGGRYMIHNSGQKTQLSILNDYTPYSLSEKEEKERVFMSLSAKYGYMYKYMEE